MNRDKYIEKDIVRKIKIVNTFYNEKIFKLKDLAKEIGTSIVTIRSDIQMLNQMFSTDDNPFIMFDPLQGYLINLTEKFSKQDCIKSIYGESLFLKACQFFLKDQYATAEKFAIKEFISFSKAYELRKKFKNYLQDLGITDFDNHNPNEECYIRYLMTFLQISRGKQFVTITTTEKYKFNKLFNSIERIENCVFSDYSKQYASILFQLHFKRQTNFPIKFADSLKKQLQNTPMYKKISPFIEKFLKDEKFFNNNDNEIMYFFVIFSIMNVNYFEDYTVSKIKNTFDYIQKVPAMNKLVLLFEKEFKQSFYSNLSFYASFITFIKKCLFNLQTFIPEEHYELGRIAKTPKNLIVKVSSIFYKWAEQENVNLKFSEEHIKYFSSKLFFILNKKEKIKNIYLLTSFYADYLSAKDILTYEYGDLANIKQFNPKMEYEQYTDQDLILYDFQYQVLKKIKCKKLQISYVFDLQELQAINNSLLSYNLQDIET